MTIKQEKCDFDIEQFQDTDENKLSQSILTVGKTKKKKNSAVNPSGVNPTAGINPTSNGINSTSTSSCNPIRRLQPSQLTLFPSKKESKQKNKKFKKNSCKLQPKHITYIDEDDDDNDDDFDNVPGCSSTSALPSASAAKRCAGQMACS